MIVRAHESSSSVRVSVVTAALVMASATHALAFSGPTPVPTPACKTGGTIRAARALERYFPTSFALNTCERDCKRWIRTCKQVASSFSACQQATERALRQTYTTYCNAPFRDEPREDCVAGNKEILKRSLAYIKRELGTAKGICAEQLDSCIVACTRPPEP